MHIFDFHKVRMESILWHQTVDLWTQKVWDRESFRKQKNWRCNLTLVGSASFRGKALRCREDVFGTWMEQGHFCICQNVWSIIRKQDKGKSVFSFQGLNFESATFFTKCYILLQWEVFGFLLWTSVQLTLHWKRWQKTETDTGKQKSGNWDGFLPLLLNIFREKNMGGFA